MVGRRLAFYIENKGYKKKEFCEKYGLLGHSNIRETMDYVHIVESIVDQQINNLDEILKIDTQ